MKKSRILNNLKNDLPAGLVVYLVALPLCLGVALASTGRPDLLFSGIIAGIVGGIVVGSLSGSTLGVSGPAAGLVTIVLGAISTIGSYEGFLVAVVLAGILQLIAGVLKAGVIGYYFPSSVIKGMLAAIGIILILKQIPHAFGYDEDFIGDENFLQKDGHNTLSELYYAVKYSSAGAIIISIISLFLLIFFDLRFMKKLGLFKFLPGALFVVLSGILVNYLFGVYMADYQLSGKHLVELPVSESPQQFFSFFTFPDFSVLSDPKVYIVALTIALVASLESLLSVEATDKLDPERRITPTNRELRAQGVGNMVSGLIGGLPITQVIVRSSANIDSGGKSKMATITHGIILLLSVYFIPKYLNLIPLSALAVILIVVGFKLSKPSLYSGMIRLGVNQFLPFVITVIAVVTTDLLKGIGIGLLVAVVFILYNYRKLATRRIFKDIFHAFDIEQQGNTTRLKLAREVNFFNKGAISKVLSELPENSRLEIDGSETENIEYDVMEILQNFELHAGAAKNIEVVSKGIEKIKLVGGH